MKGLSIGLLLVSLAVLTTALNFPQTQGDHILFEIKNAGISVDGSFTKFETEIDYNEDDPNNSTFSVKIDVKSINTGIDLRDEHLTNKEEFFNASVYPYISFNSTRSALLTNGNIKVEGTLTIKETSKQIELIANPVKVEGITYFETSIVIDRLDFEVGESSWMMADEVTCTIRARVN